jgi:hypothetical protein
MKPAALVRVATIAVGRLSVSGYGSLKASLTEQKKIVHDPTDGVQTQMNTQISCSPVLPGWCRAVDHVRTRRYVPRISQMPGATRHPYEGCCIPWATRRSGDPCPFEVMGGDQTEHDLGTIPRRPVACQRLFFAQPHGVMRSGSAFGTATTARRHGGSFLRTADAVAGAI